MLQVRRAEPVHVDDVVTCLARLHFDNHAPFNQDTVLPSIKDGIVYVAIDDSLPGEAAVQGAMIFAEEHESYRIRALSSRSETSRGAGRALVEYAIRRCEQEGVPKLWCWSLDLYDVKDFYRKFGFTEAHRLKKQFFGRDCWFFGRIIEPAERSATQGET
ncbi:MAG: GNAT family N-acetyltransferase [Thermoanaerobaculia bacterium]